MNCPHCGQPVPEDAVFCRSCGRALSAGEPATAAPAFLEAGRPAQEAPGDPPTGPWAPPPGGYPPGQWAPPPGGYPPGSSGNRTLIIVLAVIVAALVLMTGVAAAFFMVSRSESTTSSTFTQVTEAPPSTVPGQEETTEPPAVTTPSTETTEPGPGQWVETGVPQPTGESYYVAVSDDFLVISADSGLYAYSLTQESELLKLDTGGTDAGSPTLDGSLLAWWEGSYDETSGSFVEQAIYATRLPAGGKVEAVPFVRAPSYPQLSDGYLTWVEASPESGAQDSEVWQYSIYGVPVDAAGAPRGEPDLLTSAPRAYVIGDSSWTYGLSSPYLTWEQHQDAEGLGAGVQLMDLRSGETRQLAPSGGGRPSISGSVVAFYFEGLQALDLEQNQQSTIDASGDWAVVAPGFVVYLRAIEGGTPGWDIVARSFTTGAEQVIGTQTTPPWLSAPLAASSRHIAFVDDSGTARLFEWQTD